MDCGPYQPEARALVTLKITLKLDYACRILSELARHAATGKPVSIEHLSKVEVVPANFLSQLLGELRNGKLVESRRGVQGGFLLARPPAEITLLDIVRVMEGDLLELSGNQAGRSGRRMRQIWTEVQAAAAGKAAQYTLEQMATLKDQDMYHI